MAQNADIQPSSLEQILEILRSQVHAMPPSSTSSRYLTALQSLISSASSAPQRTLYTQSCGEAEFAEQNFPSALSAPQAPLREMCADWLVNQWLLQAPYTTVSLHLDIISALYGSAVKAGRLPKTDLFSSLKSQLKALGPDGWKSGIDSEIFDRALRLTKNASRLISDDSIAADLVILSLNSPSIQHSAPIPHTAASAADTASADTASADTASADTASADTARSADTPSSPLLPLETLALLKNTQSFGDAESAEERLSALSASHAPLREIREIKERHAGNARRKYLFPLRQSSLTPAQLKRSVAKIVNALFRRARLPQATDPNQTVEALWAYAALRTGVPASRLVAYLGHAPLGLPILKLSVVSCQLSESRQAAKDDLVGTHGSCVRPAPSDMGGRFPNRPVPSSPDTPYCEADTASADTSKNDFSQIGKVFLDNPAQWYAMSLRPGVRFTQVCRRIELLINKSEESRVKGGGLRLKTEDLRLFYPCEEIARAIGKKIVIKQRPFIHSVVFFQARLTDIGPLFARIGDLAWCYRQSARPGAPYAAISDRQFRLFQQTIARFTPDYEVASSGELELRPNDRVEILGGLFAGHEASFIKSEESRVKSEDPHTIYRLNIVGDNGFEWRIGIDKRLAHQKN